MLHPVVLQARKAKISEKHKSLGEHGADELTLCLAGFQGKDSIRKITFDYSS